jgi:hypothetical protein
VDPPRSRGSRPAPHVTRRTASPSSRSPGTPGRARSSRSAELAYRPRSVAWPEHPAVLTDLGNVLAMRGHSDRGARALPARGRSATRERRGALQRLAAPHRGASTTRRAGESCGRPRRSTSTSSGSYQSRAGRTACCRSSDVWPSPSHVLGRAVARRPPRGPQPMPLLLRGLHIEAAGLAVQLRGRSSFMPAAGSAAAGSTGGAARALQQLRRPSCAGAGARRGARPRCARSATASAAGPETQEFSRVLLLQHRARRRDRRALRPRRARRARIPGFGLARTRRVCRARSRCCRPLAAAAGFALGSSVFCRSR